MLFLVEESGFPPGDAQHNIGYDRWAVMSCRCGAVQIERLDHDCFDFEEVWDQYDWYIVDGDGSANLKRILAGCARATDRACACPLHLRLRAACKALPTTGWSFPLERGAHVHRVTLELADGALRFQEVS
jgi:hypothetical protein